MEITTVLLYILAAIAACIAYLIHENMNYWQIRGIFHESPTFLMGNMKGVSRERHFCDLLKELYTHYKATGPFCGLYFYFRPAIVVTDLDLVKNILIKDFNSFMDRGKFFNERDDPLSAHLFSLEGSKWNLLRNKLTPTFTTGKIKSMFKTISDVGDRFVEVLDKQIGENGAVIEIKDINARFTTDVIGTCAFGIECNSLKDPDAEFRSYGRKAVEKQRHPLLVMNFIQAFPKLARFLRMQIIPQDVNEFFMNTVRNTVAYRERENTKRNDFMDTLIDLKNRKAAEFEDGKGISSLTLEEISAQVFVFFLAGFETSSSTMSFAMFELARNPKIQDKVRAEVDEVLARHEGVITYDNLGEMHYLEQVLDETLRLYPILTFLQRCAKNDYDTGVIKYKIEKGTFVFIPVESIHHDPDIYPEPTKFDPERFTAEKKNRRRSCAYLPFGEGPRICIGMRFGKLQTKLGLALLFKNFKFSVCERTTIPLKFDPTIFPKAAVGGIYLKANRVK